MRWQEARDAFNDARQMLALGDTIADDIAKILGDEGRLRRVSVANLRKLKAELRLFDMNTGKWRKPK